MEAHVRSLLCWYGIQPVRECIDKVCKELYEELKGVYEQRTEPETVSSSPMPSAEPTCTEAVAETAPVEKKERRLRIVKKKDPVVETPVEPPMEPVVADEKPGDKVVEVVTLRVKKKVAAPVEVQQSVNESESDSDATAPVDEDKPQYKIKSPEEIKSERLEHRAAVEKKRAELEAQGIVPESLLTKDNLEKWLKSGMSYQRIAKELTGCQDSYISTIAKSFGLRSMTAGIIAGRYKKRK
jgi:hypothetical protein